MCVNGLRATSHVLCEAGSQEGNKNVTHPLKTEVLCHRRANLSREGARLGGTGDVLERHLFAHVHTSHQASSE